MGVKGKSPLAHLHFHSIDGDPFPVRPGGFGADRRKNRLGNARSMKARLRFRMERGKATAPARLNENLTASLFQEMR